MWDEENSLWIQFLLCVFSMDFPSSFQNIICYKNLIKDQEHKDNKGRLQQILELPLIPCVLQNL